MKKLISTSFAHDSKHFKYPYQISIFEKNAPQYDESKTRTNGKIFTLERGDETSTINIDNLKWEYLEGDGDFRSEEIKKLRDESDIIVTNPPFSLYREFIDWLFEDDKKFLLIGNKSSITYKEVFPLIKENKMWSGKTKWSGGLWFETKNPDDTDDIIDGVNMKNVPSVWFTNLDHGRRHDPLRLLTMDENLKFSRYKVVKEIGYLNYDNYDAIDVPYTTAIPSDYEGIMGVPITFLEKYVPEQFEILGITKTPLCHDNEEEALRTKIYGNVIQHSKNGKQSSGNKVNDGSAIIVDTKPIGQNYYTTDSVDGYLIAQYPRILIRKRK